MSLRIFPVAGGARFTNDWAEPRSGGRSHLGNDLFAIEGTPLLAVDNGEVRFGTDTLGGNVANLYATDGTKYYYAHLIGFAGPNGGTGYPGMRRVVRAGEVIGYLGRTGNAASTSPHVHFEVHPGNGAAVNPYPMLMVSQRVPIPTLETRQPNRLAAVFGVLGVGILTWWGLTQWGRIGAPSRSQLRRVNT